MEQWEYMGMCLDKINNVMFGASRPKRKGYGVREQNSTVHKSPEVAAQTVPENTAGEDSTSSGPTKNMEVKL